MGLVGSLNGILHSSKHTFKKACERYDMVYFGHVSQHTDEHEMVRGFTLSPSHTDLHYCVGNVNGRDIILLERSDTVSYPAKPSKRYTWTIAQIDLHRTDVPHIILNANKYDDALYAQLFTKLKHLRPAAPGAIAAAGGISSDRFSFYGQMHTIDSDTQLLLDTTTQTLGQHFGNYDYEFFSDRLIVYLPTTSPTIDDIEHMIKAGLWLANELDSSPE